MRTGTVCIWLSFALPLTTAGCGFSSAAHPGARVEGKVQYRDKLIRIGTVVMVSEDGKHRDSGNIGPDGTYVVNQAPVGKVKVLLQFPDLPDSMKRKQLLPGFQPPPAPKNAKLPKEELSADEEALYKSILSLPRSLSEPGRFHLSFEVAPGQDNRFDINLNDKNLPR